MGYGVAKIAPRQASLNPKWGCRPCEWRPCEWPMPGVSEDWLRKNNPNVEDADKRTLNNLAKLAGVKMSKKLTSESKQKTLDDALDWLRSNDVSPNDVDEPTLNALTKLAGVSMPKGALKDGRKKAVEDCLEWLRNNDFDVEDVDVPTVKTLSRVAGIPLPKKQTAESKKKTMDNAIEWLRNAEPDDLQGLDTPDLECLTRLAGVPMPGVSGFDKARALNDALDWLRKNNRDVEDYCLFFALAFRRTRTFCVVQNFCNKKGTIFR